MAVVTGDKEILRKLKKAGPEMTGAIGAALMEEGYAVWREGAKRTPEKVGILRRSWYVAPPVGRKNPTVELGVGTKYALYVHEVLDAFHPVGGPLFIKSVIDERRPGYVKRIADRAWDFFERGAGVAALPKLAPSAPSNESKRV